MAVAGLLGHKGAGYLITNDPPGAEYTINLAVICAVLFLTGPGMISLDYLLFF
jgi:putative oxidoreductase